MIESLDAHVVASLVSIDWLLCIRSFSPRNTQVVGGFNATYERLQVQSRQASFDILLRPSLRPKTLYWNSGGVKE